MRFQICLRSRDRACSTCVFAVRYEKVMFLADLKYFLLMALGVGAVALILELVLRRTELRTVATSGVTGRLHPIDGLRAFLALGVVLSHGWSYYEFYFRGNHWAWPSNRYFFYSGFLAVDGFFMITALLFWTKIRTAPETVRPLAFYRKRARRLLPLYYFLCLVVIVFTLLHGRWGEEGGSPLKEIASLLIPGLYPIGGLLGMERGYLMTQTWSLWPETIFYLVLPAVVPLVRTRMHAACVLIVGGCALAVQEVINHSFSYVLTSFWVGFLVAELRLRDFSFPRWFQGKALAALVVVAGLSLPWVELHSTFLSRFLWICLLFATVASGNTYFGVLECRSVQLLGVSSYSIYLLHLVVLYAALWTVQPFVPIASLPPATFALLLTGVIALIVAISIMTYRRIELPWLVQKRKAGPRLAPGAN